MTGAGPASPDPSIAVLRDPAVWPDRPSAVDTVETHLSHVFLTDTRAYKLKKPLRTAYQDLRRLDARRRHCETELRLNRRLSPRVYLRVVALCDGAEGPIVTATAETGRVRDWLIEMVRLPADRMLDARIADGAVPAAALDATADRLARFYADAASKPLPGPAYRHRLAAGVAEAAAALADPAAGLAVDRVRAVHDRWTARLDAMAAAVEARAARLVDGHGDLRPEHVCLIDPPAIIDCLEFDAELRRLDPAAELSLLEVETARLGDPDSGRRIRRRCLDTLGDAPPAAVCALYRAEQALVRARLAVGRRSDPGTGRTADDWTARAAAYLDLAEAALAETGPPDPSP